MRSTTRRAKCGGAGGATAALGAAVNLLNPDMHFPQSLKMTAGFDHRFGASVPVVGSLLDDIVGTLEVLYTKGLYTPFYENLALVEPSADEPQFAGSLDVRHDHGKHRHAEHAHVSAP